MAAPEQDGHTPPDRQQTSHLIGSGTLLVREGDARFTFVHRSVLEWLVARHVAALLAAEDTAGKDIPEPLARPMSTLMAKFLYGLAGTSTARTWAEQVLATPSTRGAAKDNALLVLRRLGIDATTPIRLADGDLRGQDLTGRDLHGADLARADLTEARLTGANLTGANLTEATLVRARLDHADLTGATLRGADLTGARLLAHI